MSLFKHQLRRTFLSGLVVLVPVGLTIYILDLIIRSADRLINILPTGLRPPAEWLIPGSGIMFAVTTALIAGVIVRNFAGKILMSYVNGAIERIPVVASLYKLIRQIAEAFFGGDEKRGFKRVVLVEWPRRGSWMIAFVAAETEGELAEKLNVDGKKRPS